MEQIGRRRHGLDQPRWSEQFAELISGSRVRALRKADVKRVLRDEGLLALSVPFSYRLHGFPSDYWRFTASGIYTLLAEFPHPGYDVVLVSAIGRVLVLFR